jgi:serine/threonine protein kinase
VDDVQNVYPAPDSPLPERYELGELLGRGAMADVYRGHDKMLDRPVAVKLFRLDPDPMTRRRFHDEARALARLSHPGLVGVYDVDTHHGRPYLVMQLITGQSLQTRMLAGPMEAGQVREIGTVLAGALAHAHSRGVVHRDVKPSNILLGDDGEPYLGDFGIALVLGAARLTKTNEIIGTPAYLAPEQVLGEDVGPGVDVYALGLVLLECLTGEIEYFGGTEVEIALARLHRSPRIPTGLPYDLAGLIGAMTATDPAERPTAAQCEHHLGAAPTTGLATSRLPAVGALIGATTSRWRPLAAAGVGLAALGTGLALSLGSPASTAGVQHPQVAATQPSETTVAPPPSTTTTPPPTTTQQQEVVHHHRHGGRGPGGGDDNRGGGGDHGGGGGDHGGGSSGGGGGSSGGGGGSDGGGSDGGGGNSGPGGGSD